MRALLFAPILVSLVAACGPKAAEEPPPPEQKGVTYQRDLRALVEENCLACHVEDGIGPFALDSYEALETYAPLVIEVVENGTMPPWLPDPSCRRYRDERILTEEERSLFRRWKSDGMIEGDPKDYVPATTGSLTVDEIGEPTVELSIPEAYTPNAALTDDYRCFVLDYDFAEETYLRTSNVKPDQVEMVHHVILFLVPPQFVPAVEALDRQEAGPGYTCFGGVGAGQPQPLAGWVPGTPISPGSDDAGVRIPAGAKVVMQMHYNLLAQAPEPDQSSIQLWFLAERPPYLLQATFFPYLGIEIEAGDPDSHQMRTFLNDGTEPWTIVSTAPHMHLRGKRLLTTKVAADGTESCVVDIPAWDFHWQQGYTFLEGEELVVMPGESLRLECWYDNSRGTERITWGEGTLDEMCLNTLVFVAPYEPLPDLTNVCGDFQGCYDQCRTTAFPQTGCMLQCTGDLACAQCVLGGVIGCTSDTCGPQADAMLSCFESCPDSTCIGQTCTEQILAFDACSSPIVDAGTCDNSVVACNVNL
jgi:hypothetical protein